MLSFHSLLYLRRESFIKSFPYNYLLCVYCVPSLHTSVYYTLALILNHLNVTRDVYKSRISSLYCILSCELNSSLHILSSDSFPNVSNLETHKTEGNASQKYISLQFCRKGTTHCISDGELDPFYKTGDM